MSDYDDVFGWDRDDVETQAWRQSLREGAVSCLRKLESGVYADTLAPDVEELNRRFYALFGCSNELEYVQAVEDDPSLNPLVKFDEQWEERKRRAVSRLIRSS